MTSPRPRRKAGLAKHDMSHPDAMIDMHGIVKIFKNAAGEFIVLKGIDLTIYKGEFVSIVGKSGSGKSTLLNMITGIDHPTAGKMVIGGTDIYTGVTESQRSRWRGRNLGIVFQFFQLLPMLTLAENVMLPMDYAELYEFDERPARAMEMLKLVGLEKFANKLPVSVSTGQQQLAAIARALVCDPPVLVADEPTGNLDSRSAGAIIDLFEELARKGKTVLMVTHDPSLTSRTTRNIIISDGELIDETVSRALPLLRHRHMLEITKNAKRITYPPHDVILDANKQVENIYLISSGTVNVISSDGPRGKLLAHLRAGELFGEIELLKGGKSIACVKAGEKPVETLIYPRTEFLRILEESPISAEALGRTAQHRMDQHGLVTKKKSTRKVSTSGKQKASGS
jgi:ABC-type lipoprotein export system ATPase subunit